MYLGIYGPHRGGLEASRVRAQHMALAWHCFCETTSLSLISGLINTALTTVTSLQLCDSELKARNEEA